MQKRHFFIEKGGDNEGQRNDNDNLPEKFS